MQANNLQDSLSYLIIPRQLLQHKEVSLATAFIYSYMLARHRLFTNKGMKFFESIPCIAENCSVSESTTKTAIKVLSKLGLIEVKKLQGAKHYKNYYIVHDKYRLTKD